MYTLVNVYHTMLTCTGMNQVQQYSIKRLHCVLFLKSKVSFVMNKNKMQSNRPKL